MAREIINPIKGLYLAKNIKDLQKQMKSRLEVPTQNPDLLVKVSQELLKTAKESEKNGDQEKAYVLFFKYCDIVHTIRNSPEFSKDRLYYDSMVSWKSIEDAFDRLKTLTDELKKRYDEIQMKQDQIQHNSIMNLDLESEFAKEKEVKEKWQTNFFTLNSLITCSDQISKLECQLDCMSLT